MVERFEDTGLCMVVGLAKGTLKTLGSGCWLIPNSTSAIFIFHIVYACSNFLIFPITKQMKDLKN